jgi:hypothetical protein
LSVTAKQKLAAAVKPCNDRILSLQLDIIGHLAQRNELLHTIVHSGTQMQAPPNRRLISTLPDENTFLKASADDNNRNNSVTSAIARLSQTPGHNA